jgi:hypothetical protein
MSQLQEGAGVRPGRRKDPRTKEELLDRMMSFDFSGDIRDVGVKRATIQRLAPNRISITFPDSGITYELVVRRPRGGPREAEDRQGEERSWES